MSASALSFIAQIRNSSIRSWQSLRSCFKWLIWHQILLVFWAKYLLSAHLSIIIFLIDASFISRLNKSSRLLTSFSTPRCHLDAQLRLLAQAARESYKIRTASCYCPAPNSVLISHHTWMRSLICLQDCELPRPCLPLSPHLKPLAFTLPTPHLTGFLAFTESNILPRNLHISFLLPRNFCLTLHKSLIL